MNYNCLDNLINTPVASIKSRSLRSEVLASSTDQFDFNYEDSGGSITGEKISNLKFLPDTFNYVMCLEDETDQSIQDFEDEGTVDEGN